MHFADSSAWVPIFRRPMRPRLQQRFHELAAAGELATCDMVRLELLGTVRDEAEFAQIDGRLQSAEVLPISSAVWSQTISLRRRLRRAGVSIEIPDLVIAAVAIVHEATLVHADGIFERVAEHATLQTEPVFNLL